MKQLNDLERVGRKAKISESTIHRYIKAGLLPHRKIGHELYLSDLELRNLIRPKRGRRPKIREEPR